MHPKLVSLCEPGTGQAIGGHSRDQSVALILIRRRMSDSLIVWAEVRGISLIRVVRGGRSLAGIRLRDPPTWCQHVSSLLALPDSGYFLIGCCFLPIPSNRASCTLCSKSKTALYMPACKIHVLRSASLQSGMPTPWYGRTVHITGPLWGNPPVNSIPKNQ